jgi:tRNA threonylcarbamoyladenosine biosynthesis protein TsaE
MEFISHTEQETIAWGKLLAQQLKSGDILCLYGELGAGKTTLVKGIAAGLGIEKTITSPTFTLMNIYSTKNNQITQLVHIDTYRLKNEEELIEIGGEDYIGANGTICIIEWPEKIEKILKNKKNRTIEMEHIKDGRKIKMQ